MDCLCRWVSMAIGRSETSGGLKVQSNALTSIKRYLRRYKPYTVASEIKAVLKKHLNGADNGNRQISLKPEGLSRGHVLFAYLTDAFFSEARKSVPYGHPAYWESLQMARTFLDFGYCVDVISAADAAEFRPKKNYAFYIGHRYNFVRIAQRLNADCVKVLHCDMAHPLFNNAATMSRLLALQQRKGITLPAIRFDPPTLAIEHADCAVVLGNEFTISTYTYANKPIYCVPISAPFAYPWPEQKTLKLVVGTFFGSVAMVLSTRDWIWFWTLSLRCLTIT